jgi:hypothetical protein
MNNINFLPEWYKHERVNKSKGIVGGFIIGFIILDIIFFIAILTGAKELSEKNRLIEDLKVNNKAQTTISNLVINKRIGVMTSYNELNRYRRNYDEINTIDITEREMIIEGKIEGKERYLELIKSIEEDRIFSVRNVFIIENKNNKIYFRILLDRT